MSSVTEKDIMTSADMISRVFTNIERADIENGNRVVGAWRRTIESIRPNGKNLAAHSQVVDVKKGLILIEVDHPGWIQLLQMHHRYILTGLKRLVPGLAINTLTFRLKGSKAELADVDMIAHTPEGIERERTRLLKQFDREERILAQKGFSGAENKSPEAKKLPPELQSLFDRFKSEMEQS